MKTVTNHQPNPSLKQFAAAILLVVFVLAPFSAPFLSGVSELGEPWYNLAFPTGRRLALFSHSLELAAAVSLSCSMIGFFSAFWLYQQQNRFLKSIKWLLLVLLPIPPYVHALAWSWLANLTAAAFPGIPVSGAGLAALVQMMSFLPLAVGGSLLGITSIQPDLISAARFFRPDEFIFRKIIFPLARPVVLTTAGFIFILSLLDYSIPSLFQYNVYAMEIFADFSANYNPARAAVLSFPLIATATLVLIFLLSKLRGLALKTRMNQPREILRFNLPPFATWLQYACLVFFFAQVTVPIISHAALTGSIKNILAAISTSTGELATSLQISLLSALVCTAAALPIGSLLAEKKKRAIGWWLVVLLPLAFPAPLTGIGLEALWNRPVFQSVYTSSVILVLASSGRFLSFAAVLLAAHLRRIDRQLLEAARIFQKNSFHAFFTVTLPIYLPGLLMSAAIVFVLSLGELGATVLVVPPGKSTLTLRIYNFLHYGASGTVAGISLGLSLVIFIVGLVIIFAINKSGRVFRRLPTQ